MPRFVILKHHHQGVHWDFMLDTGHALRTWRLEEAPDQTGAISATALPDHRRMYLDYEGEVSGGRGHVLRWDAGEFDWMVDQPEFVTLAIRGARVRGHVHLTKSEAERWTFRLTPEEEGSEEFATS